jgi:hypothetical protein
MNGDFTIAGSFGRSHEASSGAGCAVGFVMRMVQRRAGLFDVRARVGSLSCLEERGNVQEYLGDVEEEKRRPPECAGKHA